MPNWLWITIVFVAVVPGAAVILAGVVAMFMMPQKPAAEPNDGGEAAHVGDDNDGDGHAVT